MKLQFFTVPAKWLEEAQQVLNTFCLQHRIMTLEKHFVDLGDESFDSRRASKCNGAMSMTRLIGGIPAPGITRVLPDWFLFLRVGCDSRRSAPVLRSHAARGNEIDLYLLTLL